MGVTNLCKLIARYSPPSTEPGPFDSLIIDCQGFLYSAIEMSLETKEEVLFHEICDHTWLEIKKLIDTFAQFAPEPLAVVLSFDGEGPPMKYPKQRERRTRPQGNKSFYRYVLFGNNTISHSVAFYVTERLREFQTPLTAVISGCDVPGEGEHKIFHVAEKMGYTRPVVASVDQDVFILSLLRLDRYSSVQVYRYQKFYDVTRLARLPRFVDVSFLFGNDFVKALVTITPDNVEAIQKAMEWDDDPCPAVALGRFLNRIRSRLRFKTVPRVDRGLLVSFWMTYLWVLDYYTQRCFPQQFMANGVYEAFDRDHLLTGLMDGGSSSALEEARERYRGVQSEPVKNAGDQVYKDERLLQRLRSYWQAPENGSCKVLRIRYPSTK